MKKNCSALLFLFLFALPSAFADSQDDAADQKALRKQLKTVEGRDAMQKQRDQEQDVNYEAFAEKAALARKKQKDREDYLTQNFEKVYLQEAAKARRTFDLDTLNFLEEIAKTRYQKEPGRRTTQYALATFYLYDCEYETYMYNTIEQMYEKPRILKRRGETALKGLVIVEKMLADSPKDPDLWRMKGIFLSCQMDKMFSRSRNFVDAEAALKTAVAYAGEEPSEAKLALARFYFNQPAKRGRNVEKAVALAQELAQNKSTYLAMEAHLIVGRAAEEKYDYDTAYNEFREARGKEINNPEALYFYNMARRDRKRFKKLMAAP